MQTVRAKKALGQHFLTDESIALRIVESLDNEIRNVLEVGPGMGVLTKHLVTRSNTNFRAIEIDLESADFLHQNYPQLHLIEGDFLRLPLDNLFDSPFAVIGNFPYNISSQILFRVYEHRNLVPEVVGMFQKEVAERITAKPGSKVYGILSVLLSAFYETEYLFTVSEHVFNPPPKVKSAVIRLRRNSTSQLDCDETLFVKTVKAGFNQRRKTLRNALKPLCMDIDSVPASLLSCRAEQLSVDKFVKLTNCLLPLNQPA